MLCFGLNHTIKNDLALEWLQVCLNDRIMYDGRLNEATGNVKPSTGCTRNDGYRVYLEGIGKMERYLWMQLDFRDPSKAV
jgi:hypothetical protein